MRYIKYVIAVSVFLAGKLNAQLYDAQWVIGPTISALDFRVTDTVVLHSNPSPMQIFLTSANICDAQGNLLYFTNGIYVAGSGGDSLPNANGLNPCTYTASYANSGLNIRQAALFLPKPGDSTRYLLIHFSLDSANGNLPGTLYYTEIQDSGLGYIIKKNVPFGIGLFNDGGMTACKHANGRDYWVVMGQYNSNEYFKYLFTPDTILGPFIQNHIGPIYSGFFDLSYSKFSMDGSKYVTGAGQGYVTIMDFDRCTGEFSNPDSIFNEASTDSTISLTGSVAVEFSPNGRFVYVSGRLNLNQYDLWSSNIQDSVEIYRADTSDFAQIDFVQLGPNGKLYGCTWNGGFYFLHVINYPDSLGHGCHFVWGGQPTLSNNSINLPNMINYKLGPLVGSGCDTLATATGNNLSKYEIPIRIIPNPADKYVYVEMGMQGNYEMQLLNEMGQVIARKETRQVDIFDTERLASGVYYIKVFDKPAPNEILTRKIIVVH